MRNTLRGGLVALCVCGLAGCGGSSTSQYNRQMKAVLKDFSDMTESCRAIKQDGQVDGMKSRLRDIRSRLDTDYRKLESLEPGTEKEKVRLQKKYGYVVLSARASLARQVTRVDSGEKGKLLVAESLSNLPIPLPKVNGSSFPPHLVAAAAGQ